MFLKQSVFKEELVLKDDKDLDTGVVEFLFPLLGGKGGAGVFPGTRLMYEAHFLGVQ